MDIAVSPQGEPCGTLQKWITQRGNWSTKMKVQQRMEDNTGTEIKVKRNGLWER